MIIGQRVTVLGGGVGGLAAACALAQLGARVQVIEQAAQIAEVGAGLQISPNGAAVLEGLGVLQAVARTAVASEGVTLRDAGKGRQVLHMDLRGRGTFLLCHRADLIAALEQRARDLDVQIRVAEPVARVEVDGPAPVLHMADGRVETVELLVGADGVRSVLRRAILGDTAPAFTGQVAWRALVPSVPGQTVAGAQVFMGPGRHLVCYPLRGGTVLNIVGVEERAEWALEGWSHEGDPVAFRAAFAGFGGPVPAYLNDVHKVGLWGLFRHPVAARWSQGGAVLLGDAAHPTLPFLAQGANLALEDAWVLAQSLAGSGSTAEGFAAYQALRHARVTRTLNAASANARNYHLRQPLVRWVAHSGLRILGALAPDVMPNRFRWLYDHDVTQP